MRKTIFLLTAGMLVTYVARAEITDTEISKLYAKPSPFEKAPREKWIAESKNAFVIRDINPQAPVHLLVIPKKRIPTLLQASDELIGEMMGLAKLAAEQEGISREGFRTIINTHPRGGQGVYHLHIHVLGGRQMRWPPG